MSDLRKAAEALIVHWEAGEYKNCTGYMAGYVATLRQALDDKPPVKSYCGGNANYCTPPQYEVVAEHPDGTYTTRRIPKREWVGLTDEEIYDYADKFLYQHGSNYGIRSFGKAIEAKLKEKNVPQP